MDIVYVYFLLFFFFLPVRHCLCASTQRSRKWSREKWEKERLLTRSRRHRHPLPSTRVSRGRWNPRRIVFHNPPQHLHTSLCHQLSATQSALRCCCCVFSFFQLFFPAGFSLSRIVWQLFFSGFCILRSKVRLFIVLKRLRYLVSKVFFFFLFSAAAFIASLHSETTNPLAGRIYVYMHFEKNVQYLRKELVEWCWLLPYLIAMRWSIILQRVEWVAKQSKVVPGITINWALFLKKKRYLSRGTPKTCTFNIQRVSHFFPRGNRWCQQIFS